MKTVIVCSEVRPSGDNNPGCILVAYQDVRHCERDIDIGNASNLGEVKERLRAAGIVLGGRSPLARTPPNSRSSSPAAIQIIAQDEHGTERRFTGDNLDVYSLSSGLTLYYLRVPEAVEDCRWLIGRTLELAEMESCRPGSAGADAASVDGRNAGSEDRPLETLKSR